MAGGPMVDSNLTEASNKKLAAGLLAIFLGSLGVHKFVLGYNTAGLIMLLVTVLTCGIAGFVMGVIGIIEGIIYLTKTPEEFESIYIQNSKEWF
jgi:TM2 domain-containing membrane protein YozV